MSSDSIEFKLQNTLRCHTKPVNHLTVSPECSRLISIGDDSKVIVWSITSGEKLFVAERPFNGAATAVSWASRDTSCFVVGFASGDLHFFWSENGKTYHDKVGVVTGTGAVEDIAYDPVHDRIACICGKSSQLWKIKGTELVPILPSPLVSEGYGKCVHFCDNGASVVMYYLETHECVCYSIDPWERRWSKKLNSRIGHASLNRDGKLLLVSNLKDGIDEYLFPSLEKVQTFIHPIDTNCILQTRALPLGNLIVAGGDDGFARVFNRISGQLVSEVRHGAHGQLVQVVEAFIDPVAVERCVIVTASSGRAPYELKLWLYQPIKAPVSSKELTAPPANPSMSTWWDRITIAFITFLFLLALLVVILVVIFLVEHPETAAVHMKNTQAWRFRLRISNGD